MLKFCMTEGWISKEWEKVTANSNTCSGVLMKSVTNLNQDTQEPYLD